MPWTKLMDKIEKKVYRTLNFINQSIEKNNKEGDIRTGYTRATVLGAVVDARLLCGSDSNRIVCSLKIITGPPPIF